MSGGEVRALDLETWRLCVLVLKIRICSESESAEQI